MVQTREERQVFLLCFLTDILLYWVALNAATLARLGSLIYFDLGTLQRDRAVCLILYALGAAIIGTCSRARLSDRFDSIYYTCILLLAMGVAQLLAATVIPRDLRTISRRELALAAAIAGVLLAGWRYCLAGLTSRFRSFGRSFCVVGSGTAARGIADAIGRNPNVRAEARCLTREELDAHIEGRKRGASAEAPLREEAILVLGSRDRDEFAEILVLCEGNFRRTFLYPCVHDTLFFRQARLVSIAGIPLIEVRRQQATPPYLYLKRLMDISVAAVGLVATLPVCVVTVLAIKVTSRGPILYAQERMGKAGRRFKLYKFRSMVVGAEDETGPVWAEAGDARITGVGHFIRKHRIDEIPQLVNVLKGDMSLVGPRPERPHFHEEFCRKRPLFAVRLAVRPGVTSLSHVLGSYASEPEDRLRYDLAYIGNISLFADLKILAATVRVVLGAKGAQ